MKNSNMALYLLKINVGQQPEDADYTLQLKNPSAELINSGRLWDMSDRANSLYDYPIFYSFSEPFDSIDYPTNDQYLKIVSGKALRLIDENFPNSGIRRARVVVINTLLNTSGDPRENMADDDEIISESLKNPEFYSDDYYIIEIPIKSDVLDLNKSEYKKYPDGSMGFIHKYVFSDKVDSFPPIFTIKEDLGATFITDELRSLWKNAEITGTAYLSLDEPFKIPDVDVPIEH